MGIRKLFFLTCLIVYNLRECLSQISEEYYYGSIENDTDANLKVISTIPTVPTPRPHTLLDRQLSIGAFRDFRDSLMPPRMNRKKFFRRKSNSTRNPLNATDKNGRRYEHNWHYADGVTRVFYHWTYTKETFHGDIVDVAYFEDHDTLSPETKDLIDKEWYDALYQDGESNRFEMRLELEKYMQITPHGNQPQMVLSCYYIGTTYLNAMQDLREYFSLRYMYVHNVEYEIGYIIQEIVHKYSGALELFQLMQDKYYHQTEHRTIVPSAYMFYIYTHILHQSQEIMHLCNMLQEVERKYKNTSASLFHDYVDPVGLVENADGSSPRGDGRAKYIAHLAEDSTEEKRYKHALDMITLHREREHLQQRKEAHKQHKNLLQWGRYRSTERSRKPRQYGHFPRHYGWSIEYW